MLFRSEISSQISGEQVIANPHRNTEPTFQARHSPESLQTFLATLADNVDLEALVYPSSSAKLSVVRYLSGEQFTPDLLQRECKESLELIVKAMLRSNVPLAGRLAFRRVMQEKFGSARANKRATDALADESTRRPRPRH